MRDTISCPPPCTVLRVRLLTPGAKLPAYESASAAGLDLRANVGGLVKPGATVRIPTGVSVEIPEGYEGHVRPRSSKSLEGRLIHFGTIDSDYRGEIWVVVTNLAQWAWEYYAGDRIAQLVIAPCERVEVIEAIGGLSETARGEGAFGSTGTR